MAYVPPRPRPEATTQITRGAARVLVDHGLAPISEFVLADGLRADLAAVGPAGEIWIVEVKSGVQDWRTDDKWPGYRGWCDCFAFAVDAAFPADVLPDDAGLIVADGWGGALARAPGRNALNAARRKAVLIRFARAAALRGGAPD